MHICIGTEGQLGTLENADTDTPEMVIHTVEVRICIFIFMCRHVCMCIFMCVYVYLYMCINMYINLYLHWKMRIRIHPGWSLKQ
jgi:hypothetical protein